MKRFQALPAFQILEPCNRHPRPPTLQKIGSAADFDSSTCIARAKSLLTEGRWIDGLALTVGYLLPLWFLR